MVVNANVTGPVGPIPLNWTVDPAIGLLKAVTGAIKFVPVIKTVTPFVPAATDGGLTALSTGIATISIASLRVSEFPHASRMPGEN